MKARLCRQIPSQCISVHMHSTDTHCTDAGQAIQNHPESELQMSVSQDATPFSKAQTSIRSDKMFLKNLGENVIAQCMTR